MPDVTVTLTEDEHAMLMDDLESYYRPASPQEAALLDTLRAAQPAEPTALARLDAWVRHSQFHDFTVQRLLNAGWTVRLYVQVEPHLRQVTTRSAPTLAAAIDAALKQAEEAQGE